MLSLMSTLVSLHPKVVLKEMKPLTESLLTAMFLYCIKGCQSEKLFTDDKNTFLIEFLEEEDYEN